MRAVYVTIPGAVVRREGGRLLVFAERRRFADVPAQGLEQLVLMGNITLTPSALDLLVDSGVDTIFLTLHGKYRGRIVHTLSGNVRLRMAQYRRFSDEVCTLNVGRAIVDAKIANMRTFLQRFVRRHGPTVDLNRSIRALRASRERLISASTLDEVRGCEGSASAAYFRVFGSLLRAEGFFFDSRNRRPPLDPVNAMLSLGYTLLANTLEASVNIVGLDPYVGSLHAIETGRPSLVCDLVEEFRAPVVDALVVALINRGAVRPSDFEEAEPGEAVLFRREALADFVRHFEQRLETRINYPPQNRRLSYRGLIEQQARAMARFLLGEAPEYAPFTVR